MTKLLAAANEFPNFEERMKSGSFYDFDDMIIWVLKAFSENEELLRPLPGALSIYFWWMSSRIPAVRKTKLLKFMLNYWDTPDVFVVGDDDQSIYKFQGANMANILDFYNDYKHALHIVILKDNYRSNQQILNVSKALIDNNRGRLTKQLDLDKNLKAAHPRFDKLAVAPVISEYENPDQEQVAVAGQIKKLLNDGTPAHEIAVIYRNHSQVEDLVKYLDTQKIAVNSNGK